MIETNGLKHFSHKWKWWDHLGKPTKKHSLTLPLTWLYFQNKNATELNNREYYREQFLGSIWSYNNVCTHTAKVLYQNEWSVIPYDDDYYYDSVNFYLLLLHRIILDKWANILSCPHAYHISNTQNKTITFLFKCAMRNGMPFGVEWWANWWFRLLSTDDINTMRHTLRWGKTYISVVIPHSSEKFSYVCVFYCFRYVYDVNIVLKLSINRNKYEKKCTDREKRQCSDSYLKSPNCGRPNTIAE